MENVAIKGRGGNDVQHKNWKGKMLRIWKKRSETRQQRYTRHIRSYTDSRLKLKILERKDRQILIAVHSSGGSRPSDKDGEGDSSRP